MSDTAVLLAAGVQLEGMMLPVLAGACFALIGIAYQLAQRNGVAPLRVFLLMAMVGTGFFTVRVVAMPLDGITSAALMLGLACGAAQYLSIRLVGRAMELGPFSPIWCVLSLHFAPVVLYEALVLSTPQPTARWLATGCAIACCVLAALTQERGKSSPNTRRQLAYGTLLIVILFVNAAPNLAIQHLTMRNLALDPMFLMMYIGIGVLSLIDAAANRELGMTFRRAWRQGLLAGAGSTAGMVFLAAAVSRVGASAFLVVGMVTLILPMLAAVTVFAERVSLRWIGTLLLGLIAIAFSNM